jgi:hypothetical protein
MNTQEAKFILQAYRPSGEDASDPQFAEALAQAKLDPELAKWFAEQLAFDSAASRALKEVKAPQQLRQSIMAGRRIIEPTFRWKQPVWWAMAAAFALVLGVAGFWFKSNRSVQFATFQSEMMHAADATVDHVEFVTNNAAQIQAWLAGHEVETNYVVPLGLRGVSGMGCRVLNWEGNKISMICFPQQGTNHVDLFIAEKTAFKGSIPGSEPQFVAIGNNAMASWSQAGKVYLLVGHGQVNQKLLQRYIESESATGGKSETILAAASPATAQSQGARENELVSP